MILLGILLLTAGCATSTKVAPVRAEDQALNCGEIVAELEKLQDAREEVDSKKGVTGMNVASAILWIPGLLYTYYDAGAASELIEQRKTNLVILYNRKGCVGKE